MAKVTDKVIAADLKNKLKALENEYKSIEEQINRVKIALSVYESSEPAQARTRRRGRPKAQPKPRAKAKPKTQTKAKPKVQAQAKPKVQAKGRGRGRKPQVAKATPVKAAAPAVATEYPSGGKYQDKIEFVLGKKGKVMTKQEIMDAITSNGDKSVTINSLSGTLFQLSKKDALKKYKPGKMKGFYYGLPGWFDKSGNLKLKYQPK